MILDGYRLLFQSDNVKYHANLTDFADSLL